MKRASWAIFLMIALFLTSCLGGGQPAEYVIGGTIRDGNDVGIAGVVVQISNHSHAITDESGRWQAVVEGSVTVTPMLEHYEFEPLSRTATEADENIHFTGEHVPPYQISGLVLSVDEQPVAGVSIDFGPNHDSVVTDASGSWSQTVYGTVSVVPEKAGVGFIPSQFSVSSESDQLDFVALDVAEFSNGTPLVLEDALRPLAQTVVEKVEDFDEATGVLSFSETHPFVQALSPGDVLLSDPTDELPFGLLHKVVAVSPDGLSVAVEPGTLEDVIQEGDIEVRHSIGFEEIVNGMQLAPDITLLGVDMITSTLSFEREFEDGDKITGSLTIKGDIDFEKNASYRIRLDYFRFQLLTEMELEIQYEAKASSESKGHYPFFTWYGTPVPLFTGVWMTPRLEFRVGAEVEVSAGLETGIKWERNYKAGFEYVRGDGWTPLYDRSGDGWQLITPTLVGEAEALAYAGVDFSGLMWGRGGIGIGLFAYADAEGKVSYDFDDWAFEYELGIGVKIATGAELKIARIADLEWEGPSLDLFRMPVAYGASGRVIDEDEEGVADVLIHFENEGDGFSSVVTDENGFWSKHLLYGEVTVIPEKTGLLFTPEDSELSGKSSSANFTAEVDEENMPLQIVDPALEAALRSLINKPTGDLMPGDFEQQMRLRARNVDIASLAGMERLGDAAFLGNGFLTLELRDNDISDLTPLSSHRFLRNLELTRNQVASVDPLLHLTNMGDLDLRSNQLTDINGLANMEDLWRLDISDNQITSIAALAGKPELDTLYAWENQITSLLPLADAVKLRSISAGNNAITSLSGLENATDLRSLRLGGNQITDISILEDMPHLSMVNIGSNQIVSIDPLANKHEILRSLIASENNIANLGVDWSGKEFTEMYQFELADNQMSRLDGFANSSFPELFWFSLDNNVISDISGLGSASMPRLGGLNLSHNQISDLSPLANWPQDSALITLDVRHNQLTDLDSLDDVAFDAMRTLNFDSNLLTQATVVGTNFPALEFLYLAGNDLSHLEFTGSFPVLTVLDLRDNGDGFESISFADASFPVLTTGDRNWAMDWGVNFNLLDFTNAHFGELTTLSWWGREIDEVFFVGASFSALTSLNFGRNNLTGFDMSGADLPELRSLQLYENSLTEVKMGSAELSSLSSINLSRNQLSSTAFFLATDLPALRSVDLSDNQLTSTAHVENLGLLESLNLSGNQLTNIDGLRYMMNLQSLNVRNNPGLVTNPEYTKVVNGTVVTVPRSPAREVIDALKDRGVAVQFTLVNPD